MTQASPDPRMVALIMTLRQRGVADPRVLAAIESVPRDAFTPPDLERLAYADQALPVACGQTISQPLVVATMTEALDVAPDHRVLEVGTGTGYQTAILAGLATRVHTIERWRTLLGTARARLAGLGIDTVEYRLGDGFDGWPEAAPFDRIMVTAAAPARPDALIEQLGEGGVLIAPVGGKSGQRLMRYVKTAKDVEATALAPVRFVPLLKGVAETA